MVVVMTMFRQLCLPVFFRCLLLNFELNPSSMVIDCCTCSTFDAKGYLVLVNFLFFFNSSQLNKFSVLEFISIGKGMKARRHESRKLDNKMEDIQPKKEKSIFIIKFSFFFFIISWLHITFLIHCFFIKKKFCLSKNLGKWKMKKKNKNKSCFINSFSESHCHKKDEKNFPVPSVITADIRRCP